MAKDLDNLAFFYTYPGKYEEAEPLYKRALAIFEHASAPDLRSEQESLRHYAILLRGTNRRTEAAEMEARAGAVRWSHGQRAPKTNEPAAKATALPLGQNTSKTP
jgi:tetratricopeptide (TPR) repeat protein